VSKQDWEVFARELKGLDPLEMLGRALEKYKGRIALASSMGAEDQAITHMLCSLDSNPRIFTLDTGRLPRETYDTIEATNAKYGIKIKMLFPDRADVEAMMGEEGPNLFYKSIEGRKRCCQIRKVIPLKRELATLDAWIVGLRKEQSVTRTELSPVEWDEGNGLVKISPLADWTFEQLWDYIRENGIPVSPLHAQGYPSIGCAPCTRAIAEGEDMRAGRWWWESPEHKECGLHRGSGDKN
jgi:phosphoadenosine phosphosulfate reductase